MSLSIFLNLIQTHFSSNRAIKVKVKNLTKEAGEDYTNEISLVKKDKKVEKVKVKPLRSLFNPDIKVPYNTNFVLCGGERDA